MANTLLSTDLILNELLMRFENNTVMPKLVLRGMDDEFGRVGRKVGDTVNARVPVRFEAIAGEGLSEQDITETSVPVVMDQPYHVGFSAPRSDFYLTIDRFGERYLEGAAIALANKVDQLLLGLYDAVPNYIGTPGTTPTANSTFLNARAQLNKLGCPITPNNANRFAVVDPDAMAGIVNTNGAAGSFFHPPGEIAAQYRDGMMGRALGWGWSEDQNVNTHTVGALGGTPVVNGASQTGASIICDGAGGAVTDYLVKGDIITFASVNALNPLTYEDTGDLRQFVVTANVSSDGGGNFTVPISPSITLTGPTRNCSASPANNDVILIFGHASNHAGVATPQNLVFHRDFAVLVMGMYEAPGGVDASGNLRHEKSGLAVNYVRDFDIQTNKLISRIDILFGVKVLNGDFAVRVVG